MTATKGRFPTSLMRSPNPKITLPLVDKMTIRQIAVWQRMATNHSKQVVLKNGLVVGANGMLSVNEDIALAYEAKLQQPPTVEKV